MSDKFPPKNSGFRLETFRFPSDVTPCRHAIYHHGCPSCDERDPEGDDNDLVVGAPTREDGDSPTGAGSTPTTDFVLAAAEKVMDPILRTWFGYDCAPHEVEHYAENAAVDLSWALQDAGLLVSPATSDVIAQLCANVDRLRDERDALRAEVERLREWLNEIAQ